MKVTALILLFVSYALANQTWEHMTASVSNGDRIPMDISLTPSSLITVSHKPESTNEKFRETTNLYVFGRKLAAIRDDVDRRCYVQKSDVKYAEVKKAIDRTKTGYKRDLANTDEQRIDLAAVSCKPLSSSSVEFLFGGEIASFCLHHDVYFLNKEDVVLLSQARRVMVRTKRAMGTYTQTVKVKTPDGTEITVTTTKSD